MNVIFDVFMISLLVLVAGGLLLALFIRTHHQIKRYEFDNMTDGSVVQFESYEASRHHKKRRWLNDAIGRLGMLLFGFGVLGVAIALTLFATKAGH